MAMFEMLDITPCPKIKGNFVLLLAPRSKATLG